MKAQAIEVRAESRLDAGDAKIRRQGQSQPAADSRALHRRDERLAGSEDAGGLLVEVLAALVPRPRRRAVREIRPRAEGLPLRAQHHAAAARIAIEFLERIRDLVDEGIVEVVVRRPLDLDLADVVRRHGDADVLVGAHGLLLRDRLVPRGRV